MEVFLPYKHDGIGFCFHEKYENIMRNIIRVISFHSFLCCKFYVHFKILNKFAGSSKGALLTAYLNANILKHFVWKRY